MAHAAQNTLGIVLRNRPFARSALLGIPLALAAVDSYAQTLTHEAYDPTHRASQTVRMLDAWEDGETRGILARDVVSRVRLRGPASDVTSVNFLLIGPWGVHLHSFDEVAEREEGAKRFRIRTAWRALDLDGDDKGEIVFVKRALEGALLLQESGEPEAGDPVVLRSYTVEITCLDRIEGSLVERDIPADPASHAFQVLLRQEFGGVVNAALQQAAGDYLFRAQDFEGASYRYRAVAEWAVREISASAMDSVKPGMAIPDLDADSPTVLWLAAAWRRGSLPPFYRKL